MGIGIVTESKEECKESEHVLQGGEIRSVKDAENKGSHQVSVKNPKIFGDDDWLQIERPSPYLLFPYFGKAFVENLSLNDDKTLVELVNPSEIDSIYHSDIIES